MTGEETLDGYGYTSPSETARGLLEDVGRGMEGREGEQKGDAAEKFGRGTLCGDDRPKTGAARQALRSQKEALRAGEACVWGLSS